MKYQLISIGTIGDVAPMIALGVELKKAGGEVSLAAFEDYRQNALDAGLGFTTLPGDLKRFIENIASSGSNPFIYLKGIDNFLTPIVAPLLAAVYRAMSECDAVIFTFFAAFMYPIAQSLGIKSFEVDFIPLANNNEMPLPLFSKLPLSGIMNPLSHYIANLVMSCFEMYYIGDSLTGLRVKRPRAYINSNKLAREAGVTVLCAFSDALVPRPKQWGDNVHMTGFWDLSPAADTQIDEGLHRFVEDNENIVYAGFGSMRAKGIDELFEIIASCAGELGLPLVAGTGLSDAHLKKHANVYVPKGFVDHHWLFSSVDYAIYHGGAGTVSSVVKAGLPSFIIPFFGDQPFWADIIAKKGLGPSPVRFSKVARENILRGMKAMATNEYYRENARNISPKLKSENGIANARDIILNSCESSAAIKRRATNE